MNRKIIDYKMVEDKSNDIGEGQEIYLTARIKELSLLGYELVGGPFSVFFNEFVGVKVYQAMVLYESVPEWATPKHTGDKDYPFSMDVIIEK